MTIAEQSQTTASRAAARNFRANVDALHGRQPLLGSELADAPTVGDGDVEFVLGRDGALTARVGNQWWSGCSLPLRTARKLLEKVDLSAIVTCFLAPTHAAQLRVVLDRLEPGRAMIAVVPDPFDLRLILHCGAFDRHINAGRLWFAGGDQWAPGLARLLEDNDGLPLPGQFIRTALVDAETLDAMIATAQGVFSREIPRRTRRIHDDFATAAPAPGQVCVVAPGLFRLWDDTGAVLKTIATEQGWRTHDPDDPCHASPVAFVRAVRDCGTIIAPTLGRADFPQDLPMTSQVITWVTQPRVPRFVAGAARDRLLLADERWRTLALAAGWPAPQIARAAWPAQFAQVPANSATGGLAVIADTTPIVLPTFPLSSHKILWESVARAIADDPFSVGPDASAYLDRWLGQTNIAPETIDRDAFVRRLIVPAFQQALAGALLAANLPTRLHGRGWSDIEEFQPHAAGPIQTRDDLHAAVAAARAIVHVAPEPHAHPIDATGRPVVRVSHKGKDLWLNEARRLARGEGRIPARNPAELSAALLGAIVRAE